MTTAWTDVHPANPRVEIVTGKCHGWTFTTDDFLARPCSGDTPAERSSNPINFDHVLAATASLDGKGECKAWLIKPELIQTHYEITGDGPRNADDLMREVFYDNHSAYKARQGWDEVNEKGSLDRGVKFLQQFDVSYDYLDENADDLREGAWIVLIERIHIEEDQRCWAWEFGACLVQALMDELNRRAQLEEKVVLAFVRLKKSSLQPGKRSLGLHLEGHEGIWLKDKAWAGFWEVLGFERLNDGHLFPRDLDWLLWSPRARNASLLFEGRRPSSPAVGLCALIEEHSSDCE